MQRCLIFVVFALTTLIMLSCDNEAEIIESTKISYHELKKYRDPDFSCVVMNIEYYKSGVNNRYAWEVRSNYYKKKNHLTTRQINLTYSHGGTTFPSSITIKNGQPVVSLLNILGDTIYFQICGQRLKNAIEFCDQLLNSNINNVNHDQKKLKAMTVKGLNAFK